MFGFSDIVEIQGKNKSVTEKMISDGKKSVKIEMILKQNMLQFITL